MKAPKFRTPEQVWDLWIKALKSGKYKQTTGALKEDDSFCCLGVLCDLAIKDGSKYFWNKYDNIEDRKNFEDDAMPPRKILDYLGFSDEDADEIANLNDSEELSFEEIAEYLKVLKPICLESLE